MMRDSFLEQVDAALPAAGYGDRSTFIRDAVYDKLKELGFEIPAEMKTAPSRSGKGGRKKKSPPTGEPLA